jgi:insulysin
MTGLWTSLISDSLTEYAYDAELAGLHYNVSSDKRALFVVCGGYNDKLHVLARRVLERIRHVDITPEQLAVVKEQYKQSCRNFMIGTPHTIASYFQKYLLADRQWTYMETLEELDSACLRCGHNVLNADVHRQA